MFRSRPAVIGAVLFLLAAVAVACDGSSAPELSPSPTPAATAAPSTGSDTPAPRDLVDLARRLRAVAMAPTAAAPAPPALGDVQQFDLLMLPPDPDERPQRRTASAVLRATSEHAYFFVEEDAGVEQDEVDAAARVLEETVWPAVTGAFGLPPAPGADGDPRIAVLHADLGPAVGGYVTDDDSYPRSAMPHSNERELVYLNLSVRPLGSAAYARVLAHELQHLVHRAHDADEETWVNEGLSEVAAGLVDEGETVYSSFLDRPDTQLTSWDHGAASAAHYGASALFFHYLLEQTAGQAGALAAEPENGPGGVRAFLRTADPARTFEELVTDWAVANFLDEPQGPYGYREREVSAPDAEAAEAPGGEGEVRQFAADYLALEADDLPGTRAFVFDGEERVPWLAAQASAPGPFWWSGRGDNMDATLTRELDLTGVRSATLTFRAWFDIERWYDYGYAVASRDGGRTWQALAGSGTVTDDPLGASYGPAYTGASGGGEAAAWVEERIDLSAYAGSRVLIRFELVNDESVNRPGWAIDDIAVPEIGFFDDAGADAGGWHREGFRRIAEDQPQRFALRLITFGPAPEVRPVEVDAGNRAEIDLSGLGTEYGRAVIVVLGLTEGTTEPARYRYEVRTEGP